MHHHTHADMYGARGKKQVVAGQAKGVRAKGGGQLAPFSCVYEVLTLPL